MFVQFDWSTIWLETGVCNKTKKLFFLDIRKLSKSSFLCKKASGSLINLSSVTQFGEMHRNRFRQTTAVPYMYQWYGTVQRCYNWWICKPDYPCPSFHPITQGVQLFSLLHVRPRLSEVCLLRLRSIAFGDKVFSSRHAATGKRLAVFSPFFERSVLLLIIYSSVWNYKSIMPYIWLVHVRN